MTSQPGAWCAGRSCGASLTHGVHETNPGWDLTCIVLHTAALHPKGKLVQMDRFLHSTIPAVPLDLRNFSGDGTEVITHVYLECFHVAWIPGTWNAYLGLASHAEVWKDHPEKFPCIACRASKRILGYTETFITDVACQSLEKPEPTGRIRGFIRYFRGR